MALCLKHKAIFLVYFYICNKTLVLCIECYSLKTVIKSTVVIFFLICCLEKYVFNYTGNFLLVQQCKLLIEV
jgi:hypothetical protein